MNNLEKVLKSMSLEFFGSGKHKISPSAHFSEKDSLFLDVRSNEEFNTLSFGLLYHVPVIHIPICEISERMNEIPKNKLVGVFCSSGVRSTMVYLYLRGMGYDNVSILEGGYLEIANEFKPGKLLKYLANKEDK